MVLEEDFMERIYKWLIEGREDADNIVDLRWQVIRERKDEKGRLEYFRVTHPSIPINLLVLRGEGFGKAPLVRLVVETMLETRDLEPEAKLKLYRILLYAAKLPYVKYYLFGDSDRIAIAADIDPTSLSKEEFNHILTSLVYGYAALAEVEGLKEEFMSEQTLVLFALVRAYQEKGLSKDEAVRKLIKNGLEKDMAQKLVDMVYTAFPGKEKSTGMYI